jgi:Uma2 family endonuclease
MRQPITGGIVKPIAHPLSPEEYLELEKSLPLWHEFVGGVMYAMAGSSRQHNLIVGNTFVELRRLAQGKPYRVFQSDMKLRIGEVFYYPEAMVVCAPEPEDEYYELEPCILVEVVSPNTKDTDLREKLLAYRGIPGLQTYLVVDTAMTIRHFYRDEAGRWQQENVVGSGEIPLPCLGAGLNLLEVYRGAFSEAGKSPARRRAR